MRKLFKPSISSIKKCVILLLCILLSACGSEYATDNDELLSSNAISNGTASIEEGLASAKPSDGKYIETKNSIYDFTVGEDGTIYYSCGVSINKIETDREEEIFNSSYQGYTFVAYGNGQVHALINDGGWQLATFSTDGSAVEIFDIDMPIDIQVAEMTVFENTPAVCITIVNNTMTQGYIFDKSDSTVLPIELTARYNDLAGISVLPNGYIYVSRMFNPEALIKYEGSNLVNHGAIGKKLDLTHIVSDSITKKLYDVRMLSNGSYINMIDVDKERSTELINVKLPVSYPKISDGILYFGAGTKAIQTLDVQTLEEEAKSKQRLSIMMDTSIGYAALNAYIDYFTEKYNNVLIEKVFVDYSSMFNSELILIELMSGKSDVDIFLTDTSQLKHYYDAGMLADLSQDKEMLAALANENLIEGVRSICMLDDKVVAIPYSIHIQTLAYDSALFEKYNIPMPNSQFSFEDYVGIANAYCKDFDGDGVTDVYLNSWRHDRYYDSMIDSVLNANNDYAFSFLSGEYLSFMNESISLMGMKGSSPYSDGQYISWTSKNREDILFYPLDFPYVFSQSIKLDGHEKLSYEEMSSIKLVNFPMPYDIFNGSPLQVMSACVFEASDNKQLAVRFLTEFLDEDYQRTSSEELLLYKDISQYDYLSKLPASYENYVAESLRNYVNRSSIPGLMYWFNTEILPQFSGGNLPVDNVLNLLEREAWKRSDG